jgi:hypothetical protein
MYEPQYSIKLDKGGEVKSVIRYILQAAGLVFRFDRLLIGALGSILCAGIVWMVAEISIGARNPEAFLLIGAVLISIIVLCTNGMIARSVKLEMVEGVAQPFRDGIDFIVRNFKTLSLYALSVLGLIAATVIAQMVLILLGKIPGIGPVLYGLIFFPAALIVSVTILFALILWFTSFFIFPAHVADREQPLMDTIKELLFLVRFRWFHIVASQIFSSIIGVSLSWCITIVCFLGLVVTLWLSSMVMGEEFLTILMAILWDHVLVPMGIHQEELALLVAEGGKYENELRKLVGMLRSFDVVGPFFFDSLRNYESAPLVKILLPTGEYKFAGSLLTLWTSLFCLVCFSFSLTYSAIAGALTYFSAVQMPTSAGTSELSKRSTNRRTEPTPASSGSQLGVLLDIGGIWDKRQIAVSRDGLKMGRSTQCDIILDHEHLSREHLWVGPDRNGQVIVRDLQSTNGVMVNGRKISQVALKSGDEIQLGSEQTALFRYINQ